MTEIPDYMRLSGDEDGGVGLTCYHDACDPYYHGDVAYYGGLSPLQDKPYFENNHLAAFVDFIRQHAESHRENPS